MDVLYCENCRAKIFYVGSGSVICPECGHKHVLDTPDAPVEAPNDIQVVWISATGIESEPEIVAPTFDLQSMIGQTFKVGKKRYKIKDFRIA